MESHDFVEGVRAVIIDKDNRPLWQPSTIDGVSEQYVASYFAPFSDPSQELWGKSELWVYVAKWFIYSQVNNICRLNSYSSLDKYL